MRLGFITLGKHVPSTRFRFLPYLPYLRERGHACRLWMSYPSVYEHIPWLGWRISHALKRSVRHLQLASARWSRPDCIYLERGCLNDDSLDLDRLFRKHTARLVLDIDDGIFLERPEKLQQLIDMSDHCVVSSELIADYVRPLHEHVTIIPTAVPLSRFTLKQERRADDPATVAGRPVIGWMGTIPNMPFLAVCAPALKKLAKQLDFELFIVAPSPKPLEQIDLSGVRLNFQRWQPDLEVAYLHRMDIGLMPLPPGEEWMKYKAATKLIQYLSVGLPAVASPIGVNAIILQNNQVGLAASTPDDWFDALARLVADSALRRSLGSAGRKLVEERYSIEANAPLLESVLCPSR
ncbi:MAG: glycosyltransferase family 4 protein [Pirellulaceae bacterium]